MAFTSVPSPAAATFARDLGHAFGREPELREQLLQRRRRAERVHADHGAAVADVAVPAERRGLLDPDARLHARRQHRVAVLLRLTVEELPARHAHDPRLDALAARARRGRPSRARPRSPSPCRMTSGVPSVSARTYAPCATPAAGATLRAVERRQRLARQDQRGRLAVQRGDDAPRLDDLVRVGRAGTRAVRASPAATRAARPAGASARPRRRRSSRA